jgi:aspartyl protease family protein
MQQKIVFFAALAGFAYAVLSAGSVQQEAPAAFKPRPTAFFADAEPRRAGDAGHGDELVIERGGNGQFHLTAEVDGQATEFLVDTGADTVALAVDEAERLGFPIDRDSFVPMMQTASGTGYGTMIRLGTVEVAGGDFHDVDAAVIDGLEVNLLGQSVLRELGEVRLEGDRMVIRR